MYWYTGSLRILTNTCATALTTKQVARKMLFPPCLIEHVPLSQIKTTYTKKTLDKASVNIRKTLLIKSFKELQTQATDIQEEEIRMSINLPYVEGTSENLRRILRSIKIRSFFYTKITLRKRLCEAKDRSVTEDKKISFMKLTVVIAKQCTLVNLNFL